MFIVGYVFNDSVCVHVGLCLLFMYELRLDYRCFGSPPLSVVDWVGGASLRRPYFPPEALSMMFCVLLAPIGNQTPPLTVGQKSNTSKVNQFTLV